MRSLKLIVLLAMMPLIGCVSVQQPVSMEPNYVQTLSGGLGVAMNPLPPTKLHLPGADCLLCVIAAQVANSSLDSHTDGLDAAELLEVKGAIMERLAAEGIQLVDIDEPIDSRKLPKYSSKLENASRRNFTSYKRRFNISHLLLIDIDQVGILRTYASYVPTSDPKGYVAGTAYLIDLETNTYKWYLPVNIQRSAEGEWDEGPDFPGLTNAYFQALETAKEQILSSF